jgi:hypothetical protein
LRRPAGESKVRIVNPTERTYAKVLVFGPHGQGKTTFLGSAQEDERTSPMLLLDFEGGTPSLRGLEIDVVPCTSWKDFMDVHGELTLGRHPYKSLGIDSVSEIGMSALLESMTIGSRKDPDVAEQRDYGRAQIQLRRLVRMFRDLPMHVFVTALPKEQDVPGVGRVVKPALFGQLADEIPGIFDVVAYLALSIDPETNAEVRSLLLKNMAKFRVKARTPWHRTDIPDYVDNPTITNVLDTLGYVGPRPEATAAASHVATVPETDGWQMTIEDRSVPEPVATAIAEDQ